MINARSVATLGVGFGVVAVATLGLFAPAESADTRPHGGGGSYSHYIHHVEPPVEHVAKPPAQRGIDIEADDREVIEILSIMMSAIL